ncbi:MAG: sphingomyelinase [Chlamydiota bacterium]
MTYLVSSLRNQAARLCFEGASYLTDPLCVLHRTLWEARITTSNPHLKICNAILFPCSAISALPGLVLRTMGVFLQTTPFTNERIKECPLFSLEKFKLLTWNVVGLESGHVYTCAGVTPFSQRVDAVARKIIEQNADVVCLSEMMDWSASRSIVDRLKERGYKDFYYNIGPCSTVSSGLLVASKYQLANPRFTPFKARWSLPGHMNRGIFDFTMGQAHVFTTHLEHSEETSFPKESEKRARASQWQRMKDLVDKVQGCVVVTGDLNCKPDELSTMCTEFNIQPLDLTWDGDHFSASLTGQKVSQPCQLDWTLVRKGSAITSLIPTGFDPKQLKKEALSDHKGLLSMISF